MDRINSPAFSDAPRTGPTAEVSVDAASQTITDLLLMGLTHDMRSPLFAVLGYIQLLEKQLEKQGSEPARQYAKRARQAGLRLDQMLTETLDVIRFGNQL